jgi:hypothetical protein
MKKQITFELGDKVKWDSQAAGYIKTKKGKIVVVLPAGTRPGDGVLAGLRYPGKPRNHESYVVMVGEKYYWPRVAYLKKVGK